MKTESMQMYMDYFTTNLSEENQSLMLCLAPFTDVFHGGWKGFYADHLKDRPETADLPFDHWDGLLEDAEENGFFKPHPHFGSMGYLTLTPGFSGFLKTRLDSPGLISQKKAIETAFRDHYHEIGLNLARLIRSNEEDTRQTGQMLIGLEHENLQSAVTLGLKETSVFFPAFDALSFLMIQRQNFSGLKNLCEWVMSYHDAYTTDQREGELGAHFFAVNDRLAGSCMKTGDLDSAKNYYLRGLALTEQSGDPHVQSQGKASTLYQLGLLAQQREQWGEAETYYNDSLSIEVESIDPYDQAGTLFNLGTVAREQEKWDIARHYVLDAAQIFARYKDAESFNRVLDSLARIWDQTKDEVIPKTLEPLIERSKEEVEDLLARINNQRSQESV